MLNLPKLDLKKTEKSIEDFIRESVEKSKTDGVVLGISGGLDSACVAYLSSRAIGPKSVLGILMPDGKQDMADAFDVVKQSKINYRVKPITPVIDAFRETLDVNDGEKLELGNIKARTRMINLYYYANKENKLVAGTGDKSESLVGYFTKYGDGGVDILPIGNLYKTHVRNLSREIGVPEKIVKKPSSPGLWKGQTAEDELGIKYETLDKILYNLVDKDLPIEEIDYDRKTVEYVNSLVKRSSHKRDPLPKAEVIYCERP
jgi:NAD+ synthase